MRSDQTARFIATRPYRDTNEVKTALYEHTKRVLRARRTAPDSDLAKEPLLTHSGTVIYVSELWECGIGPHLATVTYLADSETHRILGRNGKPCEAALCVRHWSQYARHDDDELSTGEVRFGRPASKRAAA